MNETFKFYAFVFLALRVLIDLAASIIIYRQTESLVVGIAVMLSYFVFYLFLFFGIKNEQFTSRRGPICLSVEPYAYWFIVAFLVIFHLVVSGLMINLINW